MALINQPWCARVDIEIRPLWSLHSAIQSCGWDNRTLMVIQLSLLDRYVGKEILAAFLTVMLIMVVMVMSTEAVHLLSWVANGRISSTALLPLLGNGVLNYSVMMMPLSLLLGIMLAYGRLYQDSEMTAMQAAGIGPASCYRPLLLVLLPCTLLLLLLNLYAVPHIAQQRDSIVNAEKNRAELSTLSAGRFNPARNGNSIFFLESQSADRKHMQNVFQRQEIDNVEHVDIAMTAENHIEAGRSYLLLKDGWHYIGTAGSYDYRTIKYGEYGVYMPHPDPVAGSSSLEALSSLSLWQSNDLEQQAELQWRITVPVAMFILCLMALPLSYTTPRSGRYARLALAILFYLVYANLLGVGVAWIIQQRVPLWVGTWWVHIVALLVLLLLAWRRDYFPRLSAR